MKIWHGVMALTILVIVVLAACRAPEGKDELTCTQLIATPLQSYIHQADLETIISEVERIYEVDKSEMDITIWDEGGWAISWSKARTAYRASSIDGVNLDRIGIEYRTSQATIQDLLNCIQSPPKWYWAAYGPNLPSTGIRYAAIFYFPANGIIAITTGADQRSENPPLLGPDTEISRVLIVQPGSIDELFTQFWGRSLENVRPGLRPQPWPQDWEAVHYVEDREVGW